MRHLIVSGIVLAAALSGAPASAQSDRPLSAPPREPILDVFEHCSWGWKETQGTTCSTPCREKKGLWIAAVIYEDGSGYGACWLE